jgi:hypothetical protein
MNHAEQFKQVLLSILHSDKSMISLAILGIHVKETYVEAGIRHVFFEDGSHVDFTEPMAHSHWPMSAQERVGEEGQQQQLQQQQQQDEGSMDDEEGGHVPR